MACVAIAAVGLLCVWVEKALASFYENFTWLDVCVCTRLADVFCRIGRDYQRIIAEIVGIYCFTCTQCGCVRACVRVL